MLSPQQVDHVVRATVGGGDLPALLSGVANADDTFADKLRQIDHRNLSRSLLIGLLAVACLPSDDSSMAVTQLARLLGLNKSTTHRYVKTLTVVGLVQQDPQTRRYRLAR